MAKYKVGDCVGWGRVVAEITAIDESRYYYNVILPEYYMWSYYISGLDIDPNVRLIPVEQLKKIKLELL